MTLLSVILLMEMNFWNFIILMFQEEGPVMRVVHWLKYVMQTKGGMLTVLLVVWAAVGFLIGLVLGRIIWMLQLL